MTGLTYSFTLVGSEVGIGKLPVDDVPPSLDVLSSGVADVNVVGMLPHVAGQNRLTRSVSDRRHGVVAFDHLELVVRTLDEKGPPGSESCSGLGAELLLELIKRAKVTVDRFGNRTVRLAASIGGHGLPVEGVVPHLGRVVEHGTNGGRLDDFLQRLS